jgi:hypothetical protein
MKKTAYSKPALIEYGSMATLTQGTGAISQDLFNGIGVNGTGCFQVNGSVQCDDTRLINPSS